MQILALSKGEGEVTVGLKEYEAQHPGVPPRRGSSQPTQPDASTVFLREPSSRVCEWTLVDASEFVTMSKLIEIRVEAK